MYVFGPIHVSCISLRGILYLCVFPAGTGILADTTQKESVSESSNSSLSQSCSSRKHARQASKQQASYPSTPFLKHIASMTGAMQLTCPCERPCPRQSPALATSSFLAPPPTASPPAEPRTVLACLAQHAQRQHDKTSMNARRWASHRHQMCMMAGLREPRTQLHRLQTCAPGR